MDPISNEAMNDLARRVQMLEDERAVREQVTRYGFAVDVGDEEATAALYAEDCVIDIDTSSITGSPAVGQAAARGLGVKTPRRPPCGATVATVGSEQVSSSIRPWSVTRCR